MALETHKWFDTDIFAAVYTGNSDTVEIKTKERVSVLALHKRDVMELAKYFGLVVDNTEDGRVLTCVYCGMEYPQNTPAWGSDVLTEHIKVCEKHPMRAAEVTIAKLKAALMGLVGASDKKELEAMRSVFQHLSIPEPDEIAIINAINILIEMSDTRTSNTQENYG